MVELLLVLLVPPLPEAEPVPLVLVALVSLVVSVSLVASALSVLSVAVLAVPPDDAVTALLASTADVSTRDASYWLFSCCASAAAPLCAALLLLLLLLLLLALALAVALAASLSLSASTAVLTVVDGWAVAALTSFLDVLWYCDETMLLDKAEMLAMESSFNGCATLHGLEMAQCELLIVINGSSQQNYLTAL